MKIPKRPKSLEAWLDLITDRLPPLSTFAIHDPGLERFDPQKLEQHAVARRVMQAYFQATFHGLEHVPAQGGALLVGNHGRTGLDAFIFAALAYDALSRPVRSLADRRMFRMPGLRDWIAAFGAAQGNRDNAIQLLREGQLVVVYPGGFKEVMKKEDQAYQLLWKNRTGFVQVALEAGVPIIPFAGVGVEELYQNIPGWDTIERSWLARRIEEIVGEPLLTPMIGLGPSPIPAPATLSFHFDAPIDPTGLNPSDTDGLLELQRRVKSAIEGLLEPHRMGEAPGDETG